MIPHVVPTDAILSSRLELVARLLRNAARTLPLDLTDDEKILLSKEINAAGNLVRAINRILAGHPMPEMPVDQWDEPPAVP